MAANRYAEINDTHKSIIRLRYKENPKFKRSELAKELGIKPMRLINFIWKENKRNTPNFKDGCCPITGF